ncbi:MAG: nucleotide-binding protein [Ignavibacteriales bacterium]|nr:MAG: nucleotide-binding protein [Ignavibacteriales bacterium]
MRGLYLIVVSFFMIFLNSGCGEKEQPQVQNQDQIMNEAVSSAVHNVLVEEKLDASNYNYLKVSEKAKSYWIAVNKMEINPGEYVIFSKFMEMKNFKSESLGRTFESILFVDDAKKSGSEEQLKSPHQNIVSGKDASVNVEPIKNGYTVEQIYTKKSSLEFKTVKVRGKVVKVNENIMGTNWIHIQDGTGKDGTHDLLVTSSESVKVGTTIVAEGKVVKDKDFGSGYFYNVLLENSKILVE